MQSESDDDFERFNQQELNAIIRDLNPSKDYFEFRASRLSEKNLFYPGTRILFPRNRDKNRVSPFSRKIC